MSEKKIDISKILTALKRLSIGQVVFWVLAFALAVAAFVFTRGFVATWSLTQLPGIAVTRAADAAATPSPGDAVPTPEVVAPDSNLPEPWDGGSRVTILFIGLDARDTDAENDTPRSDTMILFTIDPLSKTAGVLSIPRDMWVNIPGGFGYGKINTAYALGEAYKLPGGGPGLAMKTVEQFLGVPVQYYAQVDFHAFEEAIDAMGGLYICIPYKIRVDPIGPKPKQAIDKGCQTLPGYLVLAYARNRKTEGGDVDRAERQQQVIMALRDQVLSPENFPSMVAQAPDIYNEAAAGLRTNLSFEDALRLATLATQIPVSEIKRGVINFDMVILGTSPDGLSIFKPIPDKIRVLRDEIFQTGGALSPMAVGDPVDLMRADAARVKVLNGAYGIVEATNLASRTQQYLASQGMNVVGVGNADNTYDQSKIVLHGPNLYTLRYLLDLFQARSNHQISFRFDPNADADIEIMLGNDWALNNPMPPAQ
ncbi:MAG: LCP family protein [Chloroflexi bacterium]|nr:LCP family protein [Chloroflexota bacterium]